MICYAEQYNQTEPAGGKSGTSSICVATSAGFFIGDNKMSTLICTRCKTEKPEEDFYFQHKYRQHHQRKKRYWCKQCCLEYGRKHSRMPEAKEKARRNAAKPENRKQKSLYQKRRMRENPNLTRASHLRCIFGITIKKYEEMLKEQNNCCAICGINIINIKRDVFDIDHDHETGKVRGLLCHRCNIYLTSIEDQVWAQKAQKYLQAHISARKAQYSVQDVI